MTTVSGRVYLAYGFELLQRRTGMRTIVKRDAAAFAGQRPAVAQAKRSRLGCEAESGHCHKKQEDRWKPSPFHPATLANSAAARSRKFCRNKTGPPERPIFPILIGFSEARIGRDRKTEKGTRGDTAHPADSCGL